ncbi:MAG: N-acetylmuramoyl-L-alanine amidase XlyA precursor [Pelotomaculum sp. PtaU1.Bin035]|nr:MAG: N-acetylmuramoyl-L-alanine amidase XlyA precursor [Pelotomaculum sp. PtaU1.Bin035]
MPTTYTVQTGDTLFLIARRFGTTVERLAQINNITDQNLILVGQVLIIPEEGAAGETGGAKAENQETLRISGLLYALSTNKRVYRQGEDIIITLVKTNTSSRDITLSYRTTQRYDFVARRGQEQRETWRWSRGRSFAQIGSDITLRPGSRQVFRVPWNQTNNSGMQVAPGIFTIEGYNVARNLMDKGISVKVSIQRAVGPTPTPTVTPSPTAAPVPCSGGNLLINSGFESWSDPASPPASWKGSNLFRTTLSHTGNFAAELGATHNERAVLFQRINIEPGRIYDLNWWARENIQTGGVARYVLFAEIFYYNREGDFVGRTEPRYSQEDIPDNTYQQYSLSTGRVPAGARVAEVRFTFEPSGGNNNTVKIDDAELRCIY